METLNALASRLPHGRGPDVIELWDVGEEPMAIENLVSNLHDFDIPVSADEAAWLQEQVVQLGVGARTAEFVSQLKIGDTTASGSAAGSETGPDIDIAGLASTLLGMDREAVDGLIDQAKAGMQERLSTLRGAVDGLDSDDPTARAKAEEAVRDVPDGMACIGYSSGVFEWGNWLTGLERFLLAPYDDAELLREVTRRVGELVLTAFKAFCSMDGIVALWLGDDLGFKTTTLMSPDHTREFILPWYRRYADLAHEHGMPFILHTCGEVRPVMDDLAETAGIDAKHSFEDVIQPVEEFHRDWSADVAAVGGVDMDLLAQGSEDAVAARTTEILTACAPRGAYVAGSGNSIANYVPVGNYLAMVEAVHRFNGRL